jgi:hypothetical protein
MDADTRNFRVCGTSRARSRHPRSRFSQDPLEWVTERFFVWQRVVAPRDY